MRSMYWPKEDRMAAPSQDHLFLLMTNQSLEDQSVSKIFVPCDLLAIFQLPLSQAVSVSFYVCVISVFWLKTVLHLDP